MTGVLERQTDEVVPPRKGQVIAVGVDVTPTAYDITGLAYDGDPYNPKQPDDPVYLTLQAETADVFVQFAQDAVITMDMAAYISPGGTLVFSSAYPARIPAGGWIDVRILRGVDKYMHLQGSADGICRFWASSAPRYSGGP